MGYTYYVIILLSLIVLQVEAEDPLAHKCRPSGVERSPVFRLNLSLLMRYFQINLPALHYVQTQTGTTKQDVYGFIMCRGDTTIPECKSCVSTAVTELVKECGEEREGAIWYDRCMIKFRDLPFFGQIDRRDDFYLWNPKQVSNMDELNTKTKGLLSGLVPTCTKAPNRFARGTTPFGAKTVHGMVQCSRGLSPENCAKCLKFQIDDIGNKCCNGMEGGRVVGTSCNIRYEMYPFLK
ncbi:Cysteine-rich repeat secretory protein 38 [Euphorbia peplus]|nr:Cysteine-rich repeat secretory protein 38 [Euphorbia peplus]